MSQQMMSGKRAEVRWEWIGEAWKLFLNNPAAWIGMILITAIVVVLLVVLPIVFLIIPTGIFASRNETGAALATLGFTLLLIPVIAIVAIAAGAYLSGGMYRAAIKQTRGEAISVGDLFSGGDCFLRIFGLGALVVIGSFVLSAVLSVPGTVIEGLRPLGSLVSNVLACIIGGFIFFAIPLIVDRNMGVFDAIRTSIETTKNQWWMFAIFTFVLGLLSFIGVIACGVGLLVTAPFYFTTPAVAYRDTFGLTGFRSYEGFSTPPSPPDYRTHTPSQMPAPAPQAQQWSQPTYVTPPQPPQPEPTTTTCPHCGATLARVMNFCNQCGRPMRNA